MFRVDVAIERERSRRLLLDASRLTFVSPLEVCGIVAMVQRAVAEGREVSFLMPEDPDVASYLQRMDVLPELASVGEVIGKAPKEKREDRSKVLLEVTRIDAPHEADELAERIVPLARAQADARVTHAVFTGLGELLDNAVTHGNSRIGVYTAVQTYTGETSGRRGLELAVVDGGIGILHHLRRNPKFRRLRSSETAIRNALEPGVTGTRDRRGYGFTDVLEQVGKAGLGRLVLRSGDAIARVTVKGSYRRRQFVDGGFPTHGTWVWLRIRVP